jgi:hypothetical protein
MYRIRVLLYPEAFATSHVARGHAPPAALRYLLFLWLKWLLQLQSQLQLGVGDFSRIYSCLQWQYNFGDVASCTCKLTSARYRPDTDPDTARWDCNTAPMGLRRQPRYRPRYRPDEDPDTDPDGTAGGSADIGSPASLWKWGDGPWCRWSGSTA